MLRLRFSHERRVIYFYKQRNRYALRTCGYPRSQYSKSPVSSLSSATWCLNYYYASTGCHQPVNGIMVIRCVVMRRVCRHKFQSSGLLSIPYTLLRIFQPRKPGSLYSRKCGGIRPWLARLRMFTCKQTDRTRQADTALFIYFYNIYNTNNIS